MREQKHIRKLRSLLHQVRLHKTIVINEDSLINEIRERATQWRNIFGRKYANLHRPRYGSSTIFIDMIDLIDDNNISEEMVEKIYNEQLSAFRTFFDNQFVNTLKETRDNKTIRVGSGNTNCNKIRYPSKKRSISTWKRFYKLFPHQAEIDKWDGKTSDKMK